jgi:MoxR-like ATPase
VNPTRYDELLITNSKANLDAQKLIRVSDAFRVVALSLPVPQYVGYPLDPPLRSRFQARYIDFLAPSTQLQAFRQIAPGAPKELLMKLLHVATVLRTANEEEMEATEGMQAHVPPPLCASLNTAARLLELAPDSSLRFVLDSCYPYPNLPLCSPEQRSAVEALYKRFGILALPSPSSPINTIEASAPSSAVINTIEASAAGPFELTLQLSTAAAGNATPLSTSITVPSGGQRMPGAMLHPPAPVGLPFIRTPYHEQLLGSLSQLHALGDFCIVGPKGCGKSALLKQLGRSLGYRVEYLQLFQDMSARELLQRRATLPDGDTVWLPSRLVQAARFGRICVLDGCEQLPSGTLSTLQQLMTSRELPLPDGTDLSLNGSSHSAAGQPHSMERDSPGLHMRIHPSFRIVLLARPGSGGGMATSGAIARGGAGAVRQSWLSPEVSAMCSFVTMRPLLPQEEAELLQTAAPGLPAAVLPPLLYFVSRVRGQGAIAGEDYSGAAKQKQGQEEGVGRDPTKRAWQAAALPAQEQGNKGINLKSRRDESDEGAGAVSHAVSGTVSTAGLANDPAIISLRSALSTRALIRVCRRVEQRVSFERQQASASGDVDHRQQARRLLATVGEEVQKVVLARFLPQLARAILLQLLREAGLSEHYDSGSEDGEAMLAKEVDEDFDDEVEVTVLDADDAEVVAACLLSAQERARGATQVLRIGRTVVPIFPPKMPALVPQTLFYENANQARVMEQMLRDWRLGEHLLLIGNQGVGKNKLVDHLLEMMQLPREYIQLHRDSTVQELTSRQELDSGVIKVCDSPLVVAARGGYVLVVDEADKAPAHVTAYLKALAEDGEMLLADGRRISSMPAGAAAQGEAEGESEEVIPLHPDFRMVVLANRPGYPFLGNDFFGEVGDSFGVHAVDNPDPASELVLLRKYGPDVPLDGLRKLTAAFRELRELTEERQLSYPYSTRELVNTVRHLQAYPADGISTALANVFDFDRAAPLDSALVSEVLARHGIKLLVGRAAAGTPPEFRVRTSESTLLPSPERSEEWTVGDGSSKGGLLVPPAVPTPLRVNQLTKSSRWALPLLAADVAELQWRAARAEVFTELRGSLHLRQHPALQAVNQSHIMGSTILGRDGSIAVVLRTSSDLMLAHIAPPADPTHRQLSERPCACHVYRLLKSVPPYTLLLPPRQLTIFAAGPSTVAIHSGDGTHSYLVHLPSFRPSAYEAQIRPSIEVLELMPLLSGTTAGVTAYGAGINQPHSRMLQIPAASETDGSQGGVLAGGVLAYYREGERRIMVVELAADGGAEDSVGMSQAVELQGGLELQAVHAFSAQTWLVVTSQPDAGANAMFLLHHDRRSRAPGMHCCSGWRLQPISRLALPKVFTNAGGLQAVAHVSAIGAGGMASTPTPLGPCSVLRADGTIASIDVGAGLVAAAASGGSSGGKMRIDAYMRPQHERGGGVWVEEISYWLQEHTTRESTMGTESAGAGGLLLTMLEDASTTAVLEVVDFKRQSTRRIQVPMPDPDRFPSSVKKQQQKQIARRKEERQAGLQHLWGRLPATHRLFVMQCPPPPPPYPRRRRRTR